MLLRRNNLNDLPILRELLRTASVSRTARTIGMTQSAVSSALNRLRAQFADELLLKNGRGLILTAKAQALAEQLERACDELERLLGELEFDAQAQNRRFVVAAADYVTFLLAPALAALISREAPDVSVQFIEHPADLENSLRLGTIDAVILPYATAGALRERLHSQMLFDDEAVVISSTRPGTSRAPMTRNRYEATAHATFNLPPPQRFSYEDLLVKRGGVRQRARILVENFLVLPAVVEASDCLALVQRRLAEAFRQMYAIDLHTPPFPAAPLEIAMFWSRTTDREPAQIWFRDCLARTAATLG